MGAYSEYLIKVKQQAKTLHRLLFAAKIILPLLLIAAAALTYYSSRIGTITEEVSCPDIVYGETLEYSAKAFRSKVEYYFTKEGENEKSETVPTEAGTYTIEAVGGNGRGEHKHSSTVFRILPRTATVTVKDAVCQYGDVPQIETECTGLIPGSSISSFIPVYTYSEDGESAEISIDSSSLVILNSQGKDVSHCYSVEIISGKLTMEKRAITVAAASCSLEYDGQNHVPDSVVLTKGSLREGDTIASYKLSGKAIAPGEYPYRPANIVINDADGNDVSSLYRITITAGTVTIDKRTVTVTSESLSTPYTGQLISCRKYAISSGSLVDGDTLSAGYPNEGYRAAGVYSNDFSCSVKNKNGVDVSIYYNIITVPGTITVEGPELTFTTGSAEKDYDMTELYCKTYNVEGELKPGHRAVVYGFSGKVDKGTQNNSASLIIVDAYGNEVNEQYIIKNVWGTLTINKRKLTVVSESVSFEYGTKDYSCENFVLSSGTIPGNGSLVLKITPTFAETKPGIYENSFECSVWTYVSSPNSAKDTLFMTAGGALVRGGYALRTDVSFNFDISCLPGTVEIYTDTLRLKSSDSTKYYDGIPLTAEECFTVDSYLWPGLRIEANYTGSQTEVGSSANYFTAKVTDADGNDVTYKYYKQLVPEYGTLTVLPARTGSQSTDMSGQLGTGSDSEISTSSFTPSETPLFKVKSNYTGYIYLRYKSYGTFNGTDGWDDFDDYTYLFSFSGSTFNMLASLIKSGKSFLPYNPLGYSIESVKTKNISILSLDGQPFSNTLLPCYSVSSQYASGLNVLEMSGKNQYDFDIVLNYGNFSAAATSDDYNVYKYGYLYDTYVNSVYTKAGSTTVTSILAPTSDEKIKRELAAFNTEMNNSISAADKKNTEDYAYQIAYYVSKSAEYSLYYETIPEGENAIAYFLNTSKRGVCAHFAAATTILCRLNGIPARYTTGYIAEAKSGETVTVTSKNAHAWTEVYDAATHMWYILDSTPGFIGGDSSEDTDIPEEIPKIQLTVQTGSRSKTFDGYPLTCDSFTVKEGQLLDGHTLKCVCNGSQLYAGKSSNTLASYTITDRNGNDVSALYEVKVYEGSLSVSKAGVFPENEFAVKVGETIKVDSEKLGLGITVDCIERENKTVTGTTYGQQSVYGFTMDTDLNGDGIPEFAANMICTVYTYNCETLNLTGLTAEQAINRGILTPGDGTVRSAAVDDEVKYLLDLAMGSASKDYDGQELVCDSAAILCGALCEGDRLIVTGSGLLLYAGKCRNSCAKLAVVSSSGMDVTGNYIINVYDGTLTVNCPEFAGESATVNMGLLSSCRLDDLRRCTDADITEYTLDGNDYFTISADKLRTVALGKAKLTAVSSVDVNGDGVTDYRVCEETALTCTMPVWLWYCGAGFTLICAVYFLSKLKRKKPEADGSSEGGQE